MSADLTLKIVQQIHETTTKTVKLQVSVAGLTTDVAELKFDVAELKTEMVGVKERLTLVEHTVSDAAQQIVFAAKKINNNDRRHTRAIDELRERVARLEADRDKPR